MSRYCKGCQEPFTATRSNQEFHDKACHARWRRREKRLATPVKAERTFTCKSCGQSWETAALGNFALCSSCRNQKTPPLRTTGTCSYRHCGNTLTDFSGSRSYCCVEHRRREKLFRSGLAKDESYFRSPQVPSSPRATKTRHKVCYLCQLPFIDDSLKNTRKAHPLCMRQFLLAKHDPSRNPYTSRHIHTSRRASIRTGDHGRIDDLSSLRKWTSTWWGRVSELLFLAYRPEAQDMNTAHGATAPYDFHDLDLGRVDVRGSMQSSKYDRPSWVFNVRGLRESCDYVFFVAYARDRLSVQNLWLVPSSALPESSFRFTPDSLEYGARGGFEVSSAWGLDVGQQKLDGFIALPEPTRPSRRNQWLDDPSQLTEETRFNRGRRGELLYKQLYPESVDQNLKEGTTSPYDFLDRESVRVNVKTSWWYGSRSGSRSKWSFSRGFTENHNCDVYSCLCLDVGGVLTAEYRIPSSVWADRRTIHIYEEGGCWSEYRVPLRIEGLRAERRKLPENHLSLEDAADHIRSLDPNQLSYASSVVQVLSQTTFPRRAATPESIQRDWEALCRVQGSIDMVSGIIDTRSNAGFHICDAFFGHRYDASYQSNPSLREAWSDPRRLFRAVQFQRAVGDPLLPWNVFRALKAVIRAPSNMRPSVVKTLVEKFCPFGGLVLDPCAGYGGRLVGTLAAGARYIGVDPHPEASLAVRGLASAVSREVGFVGDPFEDVELPPSLADMAITSPPYFTAERYSESGTQSSNRYLQWESWVDGFFRPLLSKTYTYLKGGAVFCLNVSDVGRKSRKYPLIAEAVRLAALAGFDHEATLLMPLRQLQQKRKPEPVLVFRKPVFS